MLLVMKVKNQENGHGVSGGLGVEVGFGTDFSENHFGFGEQGIQVGYDYDNYKPVPPATPATTKPVPPATPAPTTSGPPATPAPTTSGPPATPATTSSKPIHDDDTDENTPSTKESDVKEKDAPAILSPSEPKVEPEPKDGKDIVPGTASSALTNGDKKETPETPENPTAVAENAPLIEPLSDDDGQTSVKESIDDSDDPYDGYESADDSLLQRVSREVAREKT